MVPRTTLHLASGHLSLVNITYLVADDCLECEYLLIGRPVLLHLKVDSRPLLENKCATQDGTDYSHIVNPKVSKNGVKVNRIMVARLNRIQNETCYRDQPGLP